MYEMLDASLNLGDRWIRNLLKTDRRGWRVTKTKQLVAFRVHPDYLSFEVKGKRNEETKMV